MQNGQRRCRLGQAAGLESRNLFAKQQLLMDDSRRRDSQSARTAKSCWGRRTRRRWRGCWSIMTAYDGIIYNDGFSSPLRTVVRTSEIPSLQDATFRFGVRLSSQSACYKILTLIRSSGWTTQHGLQDPSPGLEVPRAGLFLTMLTLAPILWSSTASYPMPEESNDWQQRLLASASRRRMVWC